LIIEVSAMHYYEVEIIKDNENISYQSIKVKPFDKLDLSELDQPNKFIIEIVDFNDKLIKRFFFDFNDERLVESINPKTGLIDSSKLKIIDPVTELIRLPYYENAKEIIIYDKDLNKKLAIDVASYAKEIPKESERKPIFEKEKEEPIKKIPKTEKKPINKTLFLVFGVIAFIILLFTIIKRIHSKKTNY
jgi:hypothetical protein